MSNLRKYLTLLNKMFSARNAKDEKAEDDVLSELDHHWYKQMDATDREQSESLVIFETKEKWLAFQKAWKQFMHDGKHKKYKVPYTYSILVSNSCGKWEVQNGEAYRWQSDLAPEHHLLYGLLRNKKIGKMFKPTNKPEGYPAGHFHALKDAAYYIHWAAGGNQKGIDHLLKPFDGTLTAEDIKSASRRLKKIAERTSNFEKLELE